MPVLRRVRLRVTGNRDAVSEAPKRELAVTVLLGVSAVAVAVLLTFRYVLPFVSEFWEANHTPQWLAGSDSSRITLEPPVEFRDGDAARIAEFLERYGAQVTVSSEAPRAIEMVVEGASSERITEFLLGRRFEARWVLSMPSSAVQALGLTMNADGRVVAECSEVQTAARAGQEGCRLASLSTLDDYGDPQCELLCLEPDPLLTDADVSSTDVVLPGDDPFLEPPGVEVLVTPAAATRLADATGARVGDQLALIVDGEVESAPEVVERLGLGRLVLLAVDLSEARELAVALSPRPVAIQNARAL